MNTAQFSIAVPQRPRDTEPPRARLKGNREFRPARRGAIIRWTRRTHDVIARMPNIRKTITLTAQQNAWIEARIRQGDYASPSTYVQALVERDQARYRETQAELDTLGALR